MDQLGCRLLDQFGCPISDQLGHLLKCTQFIAFSSLLICYSAQLICYNTLLQLAFDLLQLRPAHSIKSLETQQQLDQLGCRLLDQFGCPLLDQLGHLLKCTQFVAFSSLLICYSALLQLAYDLLQLRSTHSIKSLET
ncbi:hypothetical protein F511_05324 [Dorcoceras hygrometricum]|uniref:Uncharacterized protein n=1 Tax=Dorcoceras hygrometricum TaxID=472368 RepID=A0A2Z7AU04_9LAMI|nr:hypothetical protein F511_05324 [Dorcoceras hygrometricum]